MKQIEKFEDYLEIFIQLYNDKKIDINWRDNPMTFRTDVDFGSYLKTIDPTLNEKEFIGSIFRILRISKKITTESENEIKEDQEIIDLVSEKFLYDSDFKSNIASKILTNGNYIDDFNYEVLTKRDKNNPENILGYSALLNIDYKNSTKDKEKILLELSEEELSVLIDKLQEVKQDIKVLSK